MDVAGFKVRAWSKAGVGTTVLVSGIPALGKVAFDMGMTLEEASSAGHVFLSHGHTDHVAAVVAHARIRRMAGASMAPPTYYCPTACVGPLKAVAAAMGEMDGGDIPLNIVGVAPGERIELDVSKDGSTQLWAEPFATDHRVDSQGYLIMQRQLKGLREEYQGLPREELMALRQAGTELRREIVTPLVAYSGDTRIEALQIDPRVLKSKLLIMELSFLGEGAARGSPEEAAGVEAARGKGHIHLAEVAARQDEFKNDGIVFVHFSAKYRADDITSELAAALSRSTLARVHVQPALEAFGVAGAKEAIVAFETACARPFDFGDDLGVMMATRTRFPRMKAPLGHALARRSKDAGHRGIGAVIYDEGDAMTKISLRGMEGEDTRLISTHFGGGGHAAASSFLVAKETATAWEAAGIAGETEHSSTGTGGAGGAAADGSSPPDSAGAAGGAT